MKNKEKRKGKEKKDKEVVGGKRKKIMNKEVEKIIFFFKQKTEYEIRLSLVGSEICIKDSIYIYIYICTPPIQL